MARVQLGPYDQNEWFRGAYSTIQRTLKGRYQKLDAMQKGAIAGHLFRRFPLLKARCYERRVRRMIKAMTQRYPISKGHAQKLVNILLKYHTCYYYSCVDRAWNASNRWVSEICRIQHVPIDTVMLFTLCQKAPDDCHGWVTASARFSFNRQKRRFCWSTTANLFWPSSSDGRGAKRAWSDLQEYKAYRKIQKIVRKLSKNASIPPILYEMRYLWIA